MQRLPTIPGEACGLLAAAQYGSLSRWASQQCLSYIGRDVYAVGPAHMRLQGSPNTSTCVDICWIPEKSFLILAFQVSPSDSSLLPSLVSAFVEEGSPIQGPPLSDLGHDKSTRTPAYLKDMDSGARVASDMLWHFDTLLEHSGAVSGMKGAALKLSGVLFCTASEHAYRAHASQVRSSLRFTPQRPSSGDEQAVQPPGASCAVVTALAVVWQALQLPGPC